jgi:transcriptional regulator with XRE-family HTH domain
MPVDSALSALSRVLENVKFSVRDLADISGIHERQLWYWFSGERYPVARNRLRLARAIRKQAARMLVTARMLEESASLNPPDLIPDELMERVGTPQDYTKAEAMAYRQILGLEASYRKHRTSEYAKFTGKLMKEGVPLAEAARLWHQTKNADLTPGNV